MKPPVYFDSVSFAYPESSKVLDRWTLELPSGVTSLMGRNGTGKSTFMLLASARFLPQEGTVWLEGHKTHELNEDQKNRLASVVYQNMEFENEEPLGELLEFVLAQGYLETKAPGLLAEVIQVFELKDFLHQRTQNLSKGQLQRAIMAFALLYGSRVLVMDEPVFALEEAQKHRALEYLAGWTRQRELAFLYSAHEMELSQRYSDNLLLFYTDRPPRLGPTRELFQRATLEEAYQTPFALLKQHEALHRERLKQN
ncbi:MAG: ABC transporter ATP-binding protein [Spirochaetales bacterium]|nr:ABC transporter ATP-binding protein [Spirochaetales bacterium]